MSAITPAQARAQLRRDHFAHIHHSITAERVTEAVERQFTSLDNPGFCLSWTPKPRAANPTPSNTSAKAAAQLPFTAPRKS